MIAPLRSEIRLSDVVRSLAGTAGYREKLEAALVAWFGVRRALVTHSGRTGLYFLFKALPHRTVYLPAYNCWAVTEAALRAGKQIVYVDIRLEDFNMDLGELRRLLVPGSIILATHQFGIPCDIEGMTDLARERNCMVLEDNAPAFGAGVRGKRTGSFGAAAIVSFDYSKQVVSGKGGAILFNDEELYRRVRALHDAETVLPGPLVSLRYMLVALAYSYATHPWVYPLTYALFRRIRGCSRSEPKCDVTGQNVSYRYACDDMRAKLACLGMARVDAVAARRREVADFYRRACTGSDRVIFAAVPEGATPALIKFPIRLNGWDRDSFHAHCLRSGIDMAYLLPFHYGTEADCPNAARAASEAFALPVYGALRKRDLARIRAVLDDRRSFAAEPAHVAASGLVEERRLFGLPIYYYWMDTAAFLESKQFVSLLRTHEELPEHAYDLRIGYKTFLVDLNRSTDEIFAGFDYTRAVCPIKKAAKHGIVIKQAETDREKERYFEFYRSFAEHPKRKGKILVIQRHELDFLTVLYALSPEGDYLGGIGLLPSADGRYLLAKYSATLHRCCEQDLLVWHAIQYAKEHRYAWFDLSWMLPTEDTNSDQYRLYQYKKKFGGELVDFYAYVRFSALFAIPGKLFSLALAVLFGGDINRFSLFLKKIRMFR